MPFIKTRAETKSKAAENKEEALAIELFFLINFVLNFTTIKLINISEEKIPKPKTIITGISQLICPILSMTIMSAQPIVQGARPEAIPRAFPFLKSFGILILKILFIINKIDTDNKI